MRDRLIELLRDTFNYTKGVCIDFDEAVEINADHLLAEGVKVLPCEIGDTIYYVSRGRIIPMIVNCISFNGNYQYGLTCSYADEEEHGYSSLFFSDSVRGYLFGFTKEEAEEALAERSENGKS